MKEVKNQIAPDIPDKTSVEKPCVLCAICQSSLPSTDNETHRCPDCNTLYHEDCWEDNRGCAIYGCPGVPETEHLEAIEIPVSHWGREKKPCPKCGTEILAAAVRCRQCGTVFSSADPIEKKEYRDLQAAKERFPALRKGIILILVFCIIPCSAPVAAIIGLFWYISNRKAIAVMPTLYTGLCKVAFGVSIGQTVLIVIMLVLYSISN